MPLQSGDKLGPYEILTRVGAGSPPWESASDKYPSRSPLVIWNLVAKIDSAKCILQFGRTKPPEYEI
jgi:hypothetical protein